MLKISIEDFQESMEDSFDYVSNGGYVILTYAGEEKFVILSSDEYEEFEVLRGFDNM